MDFRASQFVLLVWLALSAGCIHHRECAPPVVGLTPPVPRLATTSRTPLEPDSVQLAIPADGTSRPIVYKAVGEREVQCFAAQSSEVGNLLDQENLVSESQGTPTHGLCHRPDLAAIESRRIQQEVRYWSALERRNKSSSIALELYFRLTESEASADVLHESLAHLGETVIKAEEAKAKGIRLPVEVTALKGARDQLDAESGRLSIAIDHLNSELKRRIGLPDASHDEHLWPAKEGLLTDAVPDADAAVQFALAQRPELNLLRCVLNNLNVETLDVARSVLSNLNRLLGALPVGGKGCEDAEVAQRKHQLHSYLSERERAVASDVRQAIEEMRQRGRLAGLARERLVAQQSHVNEVRNRFDKGLVSFLEVSEAVSALHTIRRTIIQEVMAYHRARVRLKEAQGLLVAECHAMTGH